MGVCKCNNSGPLVVVSDFNIPEMNDKEKSTGLKSTETKSSKSLSFSVMNKNSDNSFFSNIEPKQPTITKSDTDLVSSSIVNEKLSFCERDSLFRFLQRHFLFKSIVSEHNFETIESLFVIHHLQENVNIFVEGTESQNLFIIINGSCELFKKGSSNVIKKGKYESFGEIALIDPCIMRTYSVKSTSEITYVTISYENYQQISTLHNDETHNDILKYIQCIPLLSYLESQDKANFAFFCDIITLKQGEEITLKEAIYISKKGELSFRNKRKNFTIDISENMYYGISELILSMRTTSINIKSQKDSVLYVLPKISFVEILGVDYQYQLIYPYFKSVMMKSEFFSTLFNELQLVPIFELFKIKHYQIGSVVYPKQTKGKIVIVLEGTIIGENNKYEMSFGAVYGEKLITHSVKFDVDVIAKYNSIVIECEWDNMKKKITSFNSSIIKKMKRLSMVEMFKQAEESILIEIASVVKKEKFYKGDIIIQKGLSEYNKFYCVIKGEAKQRNNNKSYRRYGVGNSFGELFILNINEANDEIISSSEKTVVYSIDKKYFNDLVCQNIFNDYMKHKICNEDKEIKLSDLYLVKKVSEKVSIVHNNMDYYIIKKYVKNKENYEKMSHEVNSKRKLDHCFINRIVKFIEDEIYFYKISNYLPNAISLYDYISTNKSLTSNAITINKSQNILFYACCLFNVIDYLHQKKYIHGNLTNKNVLIDTNGYIKLINLSSCHKESKEIKTKSLISLDFAAPEILNGEPLSYSSDYWSIGILLYYMFYEVLPYHEESNDPLSLFNQIITKQLQFNHCDFKLKEMLERLLCKDKNKRLQSMKEIQTLKCYEEMHFEDVLSNKEKPPIVPKTMIEHLDFNLYKKGYSNVEKNINNNNKEYSFNWIEHF